MCYHIKFGTAGSKGVCINNTGTQKIGRARALSHGVGAWLTPKNKPPPHICYHVKFGSAASKGVRINRRKP